MENYICIEGKKIELTKEQLKELGIIAKPKATIKGDIAKIGDYEFIVLEQSEGFVKLLLKDTLCDMKFSDNNNDYRGSLIDKYLLDFAEKIEEIVGKENCII